MYTLIKIKEIAREVRINKFLILALTLIILLAAGIRVGITYNTIGVPAYTGMAVYIGEGARNLAEGRGYVIDSAYIGEIEKVQTAREMLVDLQDVPPPEVETFTPYYGMPPGPSILLAGTYKVFGEYRYIFWRLLQAILTSFGCLFMFLIGKELFGRDVGLSAALIYAVYLPIAYISTWALHDALVPFFTLISLFLFIMGVRRKSYKYFILAGFATGIGCYFQPTIVLLPVFFGLGLFVYSLGQSSFVKNAMNVIKVTASMMVVLMVVVSPWVVRNYNISGKLILMRPSVWQAVWEGFGEYENPVGAVLSDEITYNQVVDELGYAIPYGTPEYDAVLMDKSLKAIKEHPIWWLSTIARRLPRTLVYGSDLGITLYPRGDQGFILWDETREDAYSRVIIALKSANFQEAWKTVKINPYAIFSVGLTLVFTFMPALLSIIGIWLMRREWRAIVLVAVVLLYYSAVNIFFLVRWKTLLPGALAYVLFSAIALNYLASKFVKKRHAMVPGQRE